MSTSDEAGREEAVEGMRDLSLECEGEADCETVRVLAGTVLIREGEMDEAIEILTSGGPEAQELEA